MVPHSWILECVAIWKTVLTSNHEVLGTVDKRGIFQGDSNIAITVCDHYGTTVTDSKGRKSWLPTQKRIQDQFPHLDKVMNKEMKDSIWNEYIRRVKLRCKSNRNAGNFVSDMNAWAIGVMRYSGGIIDWTKEELQDMDRKIRKIMTCLHPRGSAATLYMKRKGGRTRKCGGLHNSWKERNVWKKVRKICWVEHCGREKQMRNSQKEKGVKERRICMKESYKGNLWRKPGTSHKSFQESG